MQLVLFTPCLAYLVNLPSQKQTNKQGKSRVLLTALKVNKFALQDSITYYFRQRKSKINNNNSNNKSNNNNNINNINNPILAIIIIIIIIIIISISTIINYEHGMSRGRGLALNALSQSP